MHSKVEVRVAHLEGMHAFDDFRVVPWALRSPGPLGGPAHQGRGGPLGAQHTKVEVRVAHLLGMHSFDDFRVGPWALRGPGPLGGPSTPKSKLGLHTS